MEVYNNYIMCDVFVRCRLNVFVGVECCKHRYCYVRKISDLSDNKVLSSLSSFWCSTEESITGLERHEGE